MGCIFLSLYSSHNLEALELTSSELVAGTWSIYIDKHDFYIYMKCPNGTLWKDSQFRLATRVLRCSGRKDSVCKIDHIVILKANETINESSDLA